jgi:alkylhydroperoxidase family enzyme
MPRVPYVSDADAGPPELVAEIHSRRKGTLLNLDRMLLHSPALARGWNAHLGAVRSGLTVPTRLRELAICAVAVLNEAEYELAQHLPLFLAAGGSSAAAAALSHGDAAWDDHALFDALERAVLQLTRDMTRQIRVADATFERARSLLGSDQRLVELVAIVATYNMVSRFLVALGVDTAGEGVAGNSVTVDSETPG